MANFYALILNASNTGIGAHIYGEPQATLPANEVACTQAQAQNPSQYGLVNGVVTQLLSAVQAAQIATIKAACQAQILGGFSSSALGSAYNYPSDSVTQQNIQSAAQSGTSCGIWCENSAGLWSFMTHTPIELTKLFSDMVTFIQTQQQKYATLSNNISACTTISSVEAITW